MAEALAHQDLGGLELGERRETLGGGQLEHLGYEGGAEEGARQGGELGALEGSGREPFQAAPEQGAHPSRRRKACGQSLCSLSVSMRCLSVSRT